MMSLNVDVYISLSYVVFNTEFNCKDV